MSIPVTMGSAGKLAIAAAPVDGFPVVSVGGTTKISPRVYARPMSMPALDNTIERVPIRYTRVSMSPSFMGSLDGTVRNLPKKSFSPTTDSYLWGSIQVIFNGKDITQFRGSPTTVPEWGSNEPFGDNMCVIRVPQIMPYEALPAWLVDGADVDIYHIKPDKTRGRKLFEGYWATEELAVDGTSNSLELHCQGALYQADLFVHMPRATVKNVDIGVVINEIFTDTFKRSLRLIPPGAVTTGIETAKTGTAGPALSGAVQEMLGFAQVGTDTEFEYQWTVMKKTGRIVEIRHKDMTTQEFDLVAGYQGVNVQLSRDFTKATNTIFGEGTAPDGCRWRNIQYPNQNIVDPPLFAGTTLTVGSTGTEFQKWAEQMRENGWSIYGNTFTSSHAAIVKTMQRQAGLSVTGTVGAQTWLATFTSGANGDDTPYYLPLFALPVNAPFIMNSDGSIAGDNPAFDRTKLQIERFESFGERVSKQDAVYSAQLEIYRDSIPSWTGTVSISVDPMVFHETPINLKSRYEIMAGINFRLWMRNSWQLFHVSSVKVSLETGMVTMTVDQRARDLQTLTAMHDRDLDLHDPTRRAGYNDRASKVSEDRIVPWDCEGGAGRVPLQVTQAKLWNVTRIPAGELGQIVRSEFEIRTGSTYCQYAVGIFRKPVTHAALRAYGTPDDTGYWQKLGEDTGCIQAWGGVNPNGVEIFAGYGPDVQTDEGAELTGKLKDDAAYYFESGKPPWLWVAIWTRVATKISGQLRLNVDNG